MTLHITTEADVPLEDENLEDAGFMATLEAAANTARLLADAGLEIEFEDEDIDDAAATARQAARNPSSLQTAQAKQSLSRKTPAALLLTERILKEYGHKVVEEASHVRNMVVNKLIQETENPDAKVRLKALELLGKVSDVGLFTEKQEILVTHQTSDDIRARLRRKLQKLVDVTPAEVPDTVEDAEIIQETPSDEVENE